MKVTAKREEIKLYPFQQYTIDRFHDVRSVLIGDDMGLGKQSKPSH